MNLKVIKLSEARRDFVLLPRRWVVERTFAWQARFRRLARDYERLQTPWLHSTGSPPPSSCSTTSSKVHNTL